MKFRLVDKILSWTAHQSIVGIKAVSFEEYCLKEPFGEEGCLPDTLLLESLLQLGNWLIMLSSDFKQMGIVVKLGKVSFQDSLRLGQHVEMKVNLLQGREEGYMLSGQGNVNGRTVITGLNCLAMPVPAEEYVNPDDWRTLFSEIYQPEG